MLQLVPPEIVYAICHYLVAQSDKRWSKPTCLVCTNGALASLSLTSRAMRACIAPVLFERIEVRPFSSAQYYGPVDWDCAERALLLYPETATRVR